MRTTALAAVFLASSSLLVAADPSSYPLWDGRETVAEYARRAHLEPTLTLDLGDKVKW